MPQLSQSELHTELKQAVSELCRSFPDTYWRELDTKRAYPEEFVQALTKAGYMGTLIPEEYGGAGMGVTEAAVILDGLIAIPELPAQEAERSAVQAFLAALSDDAVRARISALGMEMADS